MPPAAILTACTEALEYGVSVESCLAAYPEYAEQLEPLLRIVARLDVVSQQQTSTRSSIADQEYRLALTSCINALEGQASIATLLATYPRYADKLEPLLQIVAKLPKAMPASKREFEPILLSQLDRVAPEQFAQIVPSPITRYLEGRAPILPVPSLQPTHRRYRFPFPALAVAASVVIVASLVLQAVAPTLPGDTLYPIKRRIEDLHGMVAMTFGEPVEWQVTQVERRVQELAELDEAGLVPEPALVEEVREDAQAAVDAVVELPTEERVPILSRWLQLFVNPNNDHVDNQAVATVFGHALATAESVVEQEATAVALLPTSTVAEVLALAEAETGIETQGEVPLHPSAESVTDPGATRPLPTATSRRTTATPTASVTIQSIALLPSSPDPLESDVAINRGPGVVPNVAGTPTVTTMATRLATPAQIASPTFTSLSTPTPTPTVELITIVSTPVPANILLPTVTPTVTPTITPTITPTKPPLVIVPTSVPGTSLLPTITPTTVPGNTPVPIATDMPLATATATSLPSATDTPLPTTTDTPLPTATNTPLPTATNTPLPTATNTPLLTATNTPLPTATNMPLPTATDTPLPTATDTPLPTATNTPLLTATNTPLPTATDTPLPTATNTPLPTATNTPAVPVISGGESDVESPVSE